MKTGQKIRTCLSVGGLLLALAGSCWSQQTTVPGSDQATGQASDPPVIPAMGPSSSDLPLQSTDRLAKLLNTDRQKQLVLDTQRLLVLANELKLDVDKSNKDTLSLDVIRKADEIEKLAHSVKEKMKGS
jgi:hypothetical protein